MFSSLFSPNRRNVETVSYLSFAKCLAQLEFRLPFVEFCALDNFSDKSMKAINELGVGTKLVAGTRERLSCCFISLIILCFCFQCFYLIWLMLKWKCQIFLTRFRSTISYKHPEPIVHVHTRANYLAIAQFKLSLVFISFHRSFNDLRRPF